jgi:hypothetical protein
MKKEKGRNLKLANWLEQPSNGGATEEGPFRSQKGFPHRVNGHGFRIPWRFAYFPYFAFSIAEQFN